MTEEPAGNNPDENTEQDTGAPDKNVEEEEPAADDSNDEPEQDEPLADLVAEVSADDSTTADVTAGEYSAYDGQAGPLGDLAAEVGRRTDEDLLEQQDVPKIDSGVVWEQLESGGPVLDWDDDDEERVVEKASYCESCRYFADPPDMECTHEGTEILELVDTAHVRVINCPIVQENEELERH